MSDIFEKFDNLPADYIPDNEPKCRPCHCIDIMAGETVVHSFEIPFNVNTDTKDFEIFYKTGIEIMINKKKDDLIVDILDDGTCLITCTLTPQESAMFINRILGTFVQFKFTMNDDTISYSEIYKVNVKHSLEHGDIFTREGE